MKDKLFNGAHQPEYLRKKKNKQTVIECGAQSLLINSLALIIYGS